MFEKPDDELNSEPALEPSGRAWCDRFPTSRELGDLKEPFRSGAAAFVQALRAAGALVVIADTYRPPERAYLMHWSCMIAKGGQDARQVPPMAGVAIDWTHGGDPAAAKAGAAEMVAGYQIAFPAALQSRHTQRLAIDMRVMFRGAIAILDKSGKMCPVAAQSDLWAIGASYGVIKLPSDAPHWSNDGH